VTVNTVENRLSFQQFLQPLLQFRRHSLALN
jgi:hypothetical protein